MQPLQAELSCRNYLERIGQPHKIYMSRHEQSMMEEKFVFFSLKLLHKSNVQENKEEIEALNLCEFFLDVSSIF